MSEPSSEAMEAAKSRVLQITEGFHAERQDDYRHAELEVAVLLDAFASARVEAERSACEKECMDNVCSKCIDGQTLHDECFALKEIATAIRSRGKVTR